MNGLKEIELHWDTRNEYVLTANELKSLEEKHRRELERRKKEEKKQQLNVPGKSSISKNFVSSRRISSNCTKEVKQQLPEYLLNVNKGSELGKKIASSKNKVNKTKKNIWFAQMFFIAEHSLLVYTIAWDGNFNSRWCYE